MHAIHQSDFETAEQIRQWFLPLEDLRNEISPIRVLHHAVAEGGIASTGPLMPFLSELSADDVARIREAVAGMVQTA